MMWVVFFFCPRRTNNFLNIISTIAEYSHDMCKEYEHPIVPQIINGQLLP